MAGSKSTVHIAMVTAESEKAWQLGIDGDIRWVPKSCMAWPPDMKVDDEDVDVEIETWLCVKEGIDVS